MNRRQFIQMSAASSLLAAPSSLVKADSPRPGKGPAKNVIFLVSDGMSMGTFTLTDQFIRWREGRPSHWLQLYLDNRVKRGLMDMSSLDSIVTDSSAAASSWGSGFRINNGAVNMSPEGENYAPILSLARAAGKATGLVTTATITHATPAGFAANVPNRSQEEDIALQYLEREFDLLLGGGRQFFNPASRKDKQDLLAGFAEKNYRLIKNRSELKSLPLSRQKALGLFANSHIPYELDRIHSAELKATVPTLAEMTAASLEYLAQSPNGFIVQIEGARIDHAAHSNDIGGLVFDQIAFDDAIAVAIDFAEKNSDTLIILTTDHGNANPGLNSGANGGRRNFGRLNRFRGTHGPILDVLKKGCTTSQIRDVIEEVTTLQISEKQGDLLRRRVHDEYDVPYSRMNGLTAVLGQVLANYTDIGWIGNYHTSDYVELCGLGPGSQHIEPFTKNTRLFEIMTEALGI